MGRIGLPELIILGSLAFLVFFVTALIDCLRFPDTAWRAADQPKVVWVLVITFVPCLGPLLFFFIPAPKLHAWRRSNGDSR